jgi:hypothetical protein
LKSNIYPKIQQGLGYLTPISLYVEALKKDNLPVPEEIFEA